MSTEDLIHRTKTALDGTTDGPWELTPESWAVISSGSDSVFHAYSEHAVCECGEPVDGTPQVAISIEDAEFIVAARTLVPELVHELERIRAALTLLYRQTWTAAAHEKATHECPAYAVSTRKMAGAKRTVLDQTAQRIKTILDGQL